jgi:hypothetical protein
MKFLSFFAILALSTGLLGAGGTVPVLVPQQASTTSYLITNDDLPV